MQPGNLRPAVAAGAMIAIGLWISTEFLPLLVCVLATFGVLWLRDGRRWVPLNRGFAAGLTVTVAVVLPIERSPVGGLLVEEHDRISIVHLLMASLLLAFWVFSPIAARLAGETQSRRCAIGA